MSQPGLNTNQGPVSRNFDQFADSESCLIFVMCAFKFKVSVVFDEIQKYSFTGPRQTFFASSDAIPMYVVTPTKCYPISSQY